MRLTDPRLAASFFRFHPNSTNLRPFMLREEYLENSDGLLVNCPTCLDAEQPRDRVCVPIIFAGRKHQIDRKYWVPSGTCLDDLSIESVEEYRGKVWDLKCGWMPDTIKNGVILFPKEVEK